MSRMNKRCSMKIMVLVSVLMMAGTVVWAQDEPAADVPAADVPTADVPTAVVEVKFGAGVDLATRSIEGETGEFAADGFSAEEGRVFCLTRIENLEAPTAVTHVWYYEGKTMARVELTVGSSNWRTWSSKRILPAWTGAWEVKVLDANGMVLASAGFTVN